VLSDQVLVLLILVKNMDVFAGAYMEVFTAILTRIGSTDTSVIPTAANPRTTTLPNHP
jgi:hypothetical protein